MHLLVSYFNISFNLFKYNNITLYMSSIDKFFCINLDERKDRLQHFLNECKTHNIPNDKIAKFRAINGKTYKFNEHETKMFKNADFNNYLLTSCIIKKKIML